MPDIQYKRLTRAGARDWFALAVRSGGASLWLGPDHLLSVESNNFRESYKRFYFRDIQAILVQKTNRFRIWNIILAGSFGISLIFASAFLPVSMPDFTNAAATGVVIFGLLAIFSAPIFLLHLMRGPTCKTLLRTAVQIEELTSLCRLKSTRRALVEIQPLIVAAQGGELSPETVVAQMREWTAPAATATTAPPNSAGDDPTAPPRLKP